MNVEDQIKKIAEEAEAFVNLNLSKKREKSDGLKHNTISLTKRSSQFSKM